MGLVLCFQQNCASPIQEKKELYEFLRWTCLTLHFLTGMCLYQSNHPHEISFLVSLLILYNCYLSSTFWATEIGSFVIYLLGSPWYSWNFWARSIMMMMIFPVNWFVNIPVWHSWPVTVTAVVFNVIVVLLYGGDVKYIGCVSCTLGFSVKSNEMMIFFLCTFGISDLITNTKKNDVHL